MKKRLSLSIALAALLSLGMFAVAAPAPLAHAAPPSDHTIIHETDLSSEASYSGQYDTPSGVVSWAVRYGITTGRTQTPSGKTITKAVSALISECMNCDDPNARIDFLGFGSSPVSASDVQIDKKLETAAIFEPVDVTVIVQDGNALPWGTAITLHVDPTQWTGVGSISTQSTIFRERMPGFSLLIHMNGRSREATVEGGFSYTAPFKNVAVSASNATNVSASFFDGRSMTITIQHA